jgi:hypothetical protein
VRIVLIPKEALDNWKRCLPGPAHHTRGRPCTNSRTHTKTPRSPTSNRGASAKCDLFEPDNRSGEGDTMELGRLVPFLQQALEGDDPPIIVYFDRGGMHFAAYPFKRETHPPPPWLVKNVEAAMSRTRPSRRNRGTGGGS